jgi:hypothetical protein
VQKSGGGVPYGVGINDEGRRGLQTPAINFAGLAVSRAGGGKGDGVGECGLLIGVARGRNGRALRRIEEGKGVTVGETVTGVIDGRRLRTTSC